MTDFVSSFLAIVAHTPVWVWAVLLLVLYLGFQRTRDRTTSIGRLLLLPGVMAILALSNLVSADWSAAPAIAVGIAVGVVGGFLLEREGATRRLPDGRVWLRGEWASMLQVLVVFAVRYASAVVAAVNPDLAASPSWHLGTAFVSAGLAALFVARTTARLRAYYAAPAAA